MLRNIGKQSGVSPEEEKKGYGGKDLQKRKVLSLEWKSFRGDKWWEWWVDGIFNLLSCLWYLFVGGRMSPL